MTLFERGVLPETSIFSWLLVVFACPDRVCVAGVGSRCQDCLQGLPQSRNLDCIRAAGASLARWAS